MSMGITAAFASVYQITIDNAVSGEVYNAYKIFDVTYANANPDYTAPDAATDVPGVADSTHQNLAYSYTTSESSEWWSVVTSNGTTDSDTGVITANGLTFTPTTQKDAAGKTVYTVAAANGFSAADFAVLLNNNKDGKTKVATGTASANTTVHPTGAEGDGVEYYTGTLTLDVGVPGYIFVDTSLGSLCSLDTTEPTAIIRDKNTITTQDKTVQEDSLATGENQTGDGTTGYGDKDDVDVGDTVYYKTTVTIGAHAKNVVFHDTMTESLDFSGVDKVSVKVGDTDLTTTMYPANSENAEAVVATGTNGETFTVTFNDAWTQSLTSATTVTITYSAVLNEKAVIGIPTGDDAAQYGAGNDNKSKVTYGNGQETTEDWTRTYTWEVDIYKYTQSGTGSDATKSPLAGAKFVLYNSDKSKVATWENAQGGLFKGWVTSSKNATTGAEEATSTNTIELVTTNTGKLILKGLDADTYKLVETEAPAGFNKLTADVTVLVDSNTDTAQGTNGTTQAAGTVTITQDGDEIGNVDGVKTDKEVGVLNQSGTELPSTGGIGTTIFYVVGSILVVAAGVLLITKKRMSREG